MATKKTGRNGVSTGTAVAAAAGVTAAVAAATGAYFLYGSKNAAKNRRAVRSWMLKAKAEVLEGIESLSEIDRATYLKLVTDVMGRYQSLGSVSKSEAAQLMRELKDHWVEIQKAGKAARKTVKKAAKRGTKKKK